MKVLFVTHYGSLYGANLSMVALMDDLVKRYGVEVAVIVPPNTELSLLLQKKGIPFFETKYFWWQSCNPTFLKNILKRFINTFRIKKSVAFAKNFSPDIIHSNSSVIDLGYQISRKIKCKHLWHLREFGKLDYQMEYIVKKKKVIKEYSQSNALIAISKCIFNFYQPLTITNNLFMIHNGINDEQILQRTRCDINRVEFCVVGLLSQTKNQLEVLHAVSELIDKKYSGFHVSFFGDGDEYKQIMVNYIKENNLSDFITLNGYLPNASSKLHEFDIGIVSSLCEAFGRVTVEYMFAKLPVIGTNTGGTPEIILDNKTGFLYESGKPTDLARKMAFFINNKETINVFGNAGYQRATECFSINSNTDKVFKLYKKVLNN